LKRYHFLICALALLGADFFSWYVSYKLFASDGIAPINLCALFTLWVIWHLGVRGKYFERLSFWTELHGLLKCIAGFLFIGAAADMLYGHAGSLVAYFSWGISLVLFIPLSRFLARKLLGVAGIWARPAVIFGAGENARQAALALHSEPSMGYAVKAFYVPQDMRADLPSNVPHIPWHKLSEHYASLRYSYCVVALEASQSSLRDQLVRQLTQHAVRNVAVIPAMRGVPLFGLETTQFFSHEVLMLHVRNQLSKPSLRAVKRVFDLLVSSLLLILLSPLFVYLAYKVSRDGGAPFFGHERVGQNGKKFKCYKFRSMVVNAKEVLEQLLASDPAAREEWSKDFKLKDDPRINPIGHFLRRTSLDELPQLWNVFLGDMSLVGPRPVVEAELERYGEDVSYYLMAKPGMTGLWQVSGRNDVDYDTRVYFDSWYVKNWSLWTDIAIMFKTVGVVFGRNGAY
jgi:Undecaprenyl-phosphate galactose phosphotransferase WbaP